MGTVGTGGGLLQTQMCVGWGWGEQVAWATATPRFFFPVFPRQPS